MGRLQEVRHPPAHDRGNVQAYCKPPLNWSHLLDWRLAPPWHMETVEAWQCGGWVWTFPCLKYAGGGIWLLLDRSSTDCINGWSKERQGSWRIIFQGWWFCQLLEIMSQSLLTRFPNPPWLGILVRIAPCFKSRVLSRHVLAVLYTCGGVGWVGGGGTQLDYQVRRK